MDMTAFTLCKENKIASVGGIPVEKVEDTDGWKLHLGNSEWLMIRASGTEPVLRTYCQAETSKRAFHLLDLLAAEILK